MGLSTDKSIVWENIMLKMHVQAVMMNHNTKLYLVSTDNAFN